VSREIRSRGRLSHSAKLFRWYANHFKLLVRVSSGTPSKSTSPKSLLRPKVFLEFERYKHLHGLVKELEAINDTGLTTEQYARPMNIMIKLAKYCRTLEDVQLAISPEPCASQIRQLFMTASHIKTLTALALLSSPLEVDREVIRRLRDGFNQTIQLAVALAIPPSFATMVSSDLTNGANRSILQYLAIDAPNIRPQHIPLLFVLMRQAFHLSPGIKSDFQADFFSPMTFQCINHEHDCLRDVSFEVHPSDLINYLPDLVAWLPRLSHLLTLGINKHMNKNKHRDRSLKASVSLARLLAAIPSSMYLLVIKGTHFVGPMPYPIRRMKSSSLAQTEGPVVRCYFDEDGSMNLVTLKKMKDSKGILRWHRVVEVSSLALSLYPRLYRLHHLLIPLRFRRPDTYHLLLRPFPFPCFSSRVDTMSLALAQ